MDRDSHNDYTRFNKFVKYNYITIPLTMINPSIPSNITSRVCVCVWVSLSSIVYPESSLTVNINNLIKRLY